MAVLTLRPTSASGGTSTWTTTPSGLTLAEAVSDGDDATWATSQDLWPWSYRTLQVGFGVASLPSGARISRVRPVVRLRLATTTDPDDWAPVYITMGGDRVASPWATGTMIQQVVGAWRFAAPDGGSWTPGSVADLEVLVDWTTTQYGSTAQGLVYDVWLEVEYHERPVVTPTGPPTVVGTSTSPELSWDYSQPDGLRQEFWRGVVRHDATVVWDSGWLSTEATSWPLPVSLVNGETYEVSYQVRAKWPGQGHLESAVATRTVTLDLVTPEPPTVYGTAHDGDARVLLEVDDPGGDVAAEWYTIEYRDGDGRPAVLRAGGHLDATAGAVLIWDHEVPFGRPRTYLVRAHAVVSGEEVASAPIEVEVALAGRGEWLTDPRDPAGLHLPVRLLDQERSFQGREQVHLPAGMDIAVVESEPTVERRSVSMWVEGVDEYETMVAALRSTRTLLYRDRRSTFYFRWVGDRSGRQLGPVTSGVDTVSGTMVEVARPCT